jgi:hypothetical protein
MSWSSLLDRINNYEIGEEFGPVDHRPAPWQVDAHVAEAPVDQRVEAHGRLLVIRLLRRTLRGRRRIEDRESKTKVFLCSSLLDAIMD